MGKMEKDELASAWVDFKATGDPIVRNELVLHYQSLVKMVAAKVAGGLPSMVERDDLVSYGMFGLMDAIEKYDLDKNVKFETYAVARIKGSIIDELRALDWVPRTVRSKARDVDRAQSELQAQLGRIPDDTEIAAYLDITVHELWAIQNQTNSSYLQSADGDAAFGRGAPEAQGAQYSILEASFDPAANPEDLYGTQEVVTLLAQAVDAMPQRSKTILVLYYLQEMTLAEIGEILGVTESRVCQLQSKVLQTLRDALHQGSAAAA